MYSLAKEIEIRFNFYDNLYMDRYEEKITQDDMIVQLKDKLNTLNKNELCALNEICVRTSYTNCPWSVFEMSKIINREIVNIKGEKKL